MSRHKKILIGCATLWPFVAVVIFYGAVFVSVFSAIGGHHGKGPGFHDAWFSIAAIFFITTLVWLIILLVGYISHVYRNEQIESNTKLLWALVIFFGNVFAMPIYWYIYIWREPT